MIFFKRSVDLSMEQAMIQKAVEPINKARKESMNQPTNEPMS